MTIESNGAPDGASGTPASGDPATSSPPVVPPAPPPQAAAAPVQMTSDQLKARLNEERSKGANELLKTLGFESVDALKAVAATAKKLADEKLSTEERQAKALAEAQAEAASARQIAALATPHLQAQINALPDAAKSVIEARAGADLAKQFEILNLLRDTGALDAMTRSAAPVAPVAHPPTAPPITTAPPPNQPKSTPARTRFDEWQDLIRSGQRDAASLFYQFHTREIDKSRPANS